MKEELDAEAETVISCLKVGLFEGKASQPASTSESEQARKNSNSTHCVRSDSHSNRDQEDRRNDEVNKNEPFISSSSKYHCCKCRLDFNGSHSLLKVKLPEIKIDSNL